MVDVGFEEETLARLLVGLPLPVQDIAVALWLHHWWYASLGGDDLSMLAEVSSSCSQQARSYRYLRCCPTCSPK